MAHTLTFLSTTTSPHLPHLCRTHLPAMRARGNMAAAGVVKAELKNCASWKAGELQPHLHEGTQGPSDCTCTLYLVINIFLGGHHHVWSCVFLVDLASIFQEGFRSLLGTGAIQIHSFISVPWPMSTAECPSHVHKKNKYIYIYTHHYTSMFRMGTSTAWVFSASCCQMDQLCCHSLEKTARRPASRRHPSAIMRMLPRFPNRVFICQQKKPRNMGKCQWLCRIISFAIFEQHKHMITNW